MAAGTGGHVFPALAVAESLAGRAARVEWLGTRRGMENRLLRGRGIPLHRIAVSGLRGAGPLRRLAAPFMLAAALLQSLRVMARVRPDCVLAMGGFVCGPAGVAARLTGRPLVIHEQNAVAGLTNRLLRPLARRTLQAFPGAFPAGTATCTGNPLRREIAALERDPAAHYAAERPLRLLVLGGSQGAAAINRALPGLVAGLGAPLEVLHQTGDGARGEEAAARYAAAGLPAGGDLRLTPFIEDMAGACAWADLAVCRAGAGAVSELAAAGLPAILVPYPHHRDRQQHRNARWLEERGAAVVLEQPALSAGALIGLVRRLDRPRLAAMSAAARRAAVTDAGERVAGVCLEACGERA